MYPIVIVPRGAADLTEQLGTKRKFWFPKDGQKWLFKEGRPGTGENWSEKIAAELCSLLGIPHAHYELAVHDGTPGTVSPSFVPRDARLVLGNELLARLDPRYQRERRYHFSEHTVGRVMAALRSPRIGPPRGWGEVASQMRPAEVFVGYLMLDAWIGNTDRHHENWGLLVQPDRSLELAPTFDHASSLGRNEPDESRVRRLTTADQGYSVEAYAARARSALYKSPGDERPMLAIAAFREAAKAHASSASRWLGHLDSIAEDQVGEIFHRVPESFMSAPAREFAARMLRANRKNLLLQQD